MLRFLLVIAAVVTLFMPTAIGFVIAIGFLAVSDQLIECRRSLGSSPDSVSRTE